MNLSTAQNRLAAAQAALREAEELVNSLTPTSTTSSNPIQEDPTEQITFEGEVIHIAKFSGASADLDRVKADLIEAGTVVFCRKDNCLARRTDIPVNDATKWSDWWEVYGKVEESAMLQWHSLTIPQN